MDNIVNITIEEVIIDNPINVAEISQDNTIDINIVPNDVIIAEIQNESSQDIDLITETIIHKGYSPYVNEETGTWFEYDEETGTYVDTNIQAASAVEVISIEDVISLWNTKGADFE